MFQRLMLLFFGWLILLAVLFGLYVGSLVYVCGWEEIPGRLDPEYRAGYYTCIWMNKDPNYNGE